MRRLAFEEAASRYQTAVELGVDPAELGQIQLAFGAALRAAGWRRSAAIAPPPRSHASAAIAVSSPRRPSGWRRPAGGPGSSTRVRWSCCGRPPTRSGISTRCCGSGSSPASPGRTGGGGSGLRPGRRGSRRRRWPAGPATGRVSPWPCRGRSGPKASSPPRPCSPCSPRPATWRRRRRLRDQQRSCRLAHHPARGARLDRRGAAGPHQVVRRRGTARPGVLPVRL